MKRTELLVASENLDHSNYKYFEAIVFKATVSHLLPPNEPFSRHVNMNYNRLGIKLLTMTA